MQRTLKLLWMYHKVLNFGRCGSLKFRLRRMSYSQCFLNIRATVMDIGFYNRGNIIGLKSFSRIHVLACYTPKTRAGPRELFCVGTLLATCTLVVLYRSHDNQQYSGPIFLKWPSYPMPQICFNMTLVVVLIRHVLV